MCVSVSVFKFDMWIPSSDSNDVNFLLMLFLVCFCVCVFACVRILSTWTCQNGTEKALVGLALLFHS